VTTFSKLSKMDFIELLQFLSKICFEIQFTFCKPTTYLGLYKLKFFINCFYLYNEIGTGTH
jgi:hypothetical protein